MATYGEVEVHLRALLAWALDTGVSSVSRPGHFIPGEGVLGIHLIGGWVGPRADLYAVVKK